MSDVLLLESSRASIATAAVTIHVLRIDNRQFTKAIFSQLPTCEPINQETLETVGLIRGYVNHCIDPEQKAMRQFVLEKEGTLFRAPWNIETLHCNKTRHFLRHIACHNILIGQAATAWFLHELINTPIPDLPELIGKNLLCFNKGTLSDCIRSHVNSKKSHYPAIRWIDAEPRMLEPVWGDLEEGFLDLVDVVNEYIKSSKNWHLDNSDNEYEHSNSMYYNECLLKSHINCLSSKTKNRDEDQWEDCFYREIADRADKIREYLAKYNALMEQLASVKQLYISA